MIDTVPYVNIHTHKNVENQTTILTVGVHPYDAETLSVESLQLDDSIDAIGEIGLDFACAVNREEQIKVFRAQLRIAERCSLPVVLHSVRAFEVVCKILGEYELAGVIFHGFIGSLQQAQYAVYRGYYLSFGHRTFASPKTLDALRNINIDNIFLETDDEPIAIEEIYKKVGEYRDENPEELREKIYKNYIKLFTK